ncbi:MAG: cytochrome c oxidase subunit II [Sandaracinaceae bacterium]|nr:cytochrome c oxidase subunit II [Sandaracinaceae bacterium]
MNPQGTFQLPPALSEYAPRVDELYYFIFWISVVAFVAICVALVLFVWKFRERKGGPTKGAQSGDHHALELFWTFTPLILLTVLFHWGFKDYVAAAVAPDDAIQIRVRARQWAWEYEYPNGMITPGELTIPMGRPVKLVMSSDDVLHSYFVPEFRIKKDVVPGMYSSLWFQAIMQPRRYDAQVYCAEYCGARGDTGGHSAMLSTIHVVTGSEYEEFLREGPSRPTDLQTDTQWGELLVTQNNCLSCHHTDAATTLPAPSFAGIFGRHQSLEGGGEVTVDENYIRESMLTPQAKIVRTYTAIQMPPFHFSDHQVDAIIAYLKTIH